MAAPTSPLDLNTTASSNGPDGATEQVSVLDDYIRGLSASVKHLVVKGSDIASAATITPAATASFFDITGTTGITAIGSTNSWDGRIVWFQFDGAVTLTHSSTLKLPGAANYTTAAGDVLAFVQETSGTWRCVSATRAAGSLGSNWSIDTSNRLINSGNTQPSFYASGVTSGGGAGTTVVFGTENHDYGSVYNASTGVFTAPVAGVYLLTFALGSSGLVAGNADVSLTINGGTFIRFANTKTANSDNFTVGGSIIRALSANDTVQVDVISLGGTLTTLGTTWTGNHFSGRLLG